MNKLNLLTITGILMLLISCSSDNPFYSIPTNENGEVVITSISETNSSGITTMDDEFTVNATLPNAKEGDIIVAEILKLQIHPEAGNEQLLPLEGTQKEVTVGSDLKTSVTYSRAEAKIDSVGEQIVVTFAGETASAQARIQMVQAMTVSGPVNGGGEAVTTFTRSDTAYFYVEVQPVQYNYMGSIDVERKNGANEPWVNDGSYQNPDTVAIYGADFEASKDTMYYLFVAQEGALADSVTQRVIIQD